MTDQNAGNLRIEFNPFEETPISKRIRENWESDHRTPKTEELVVFDSIKYLKERYKRP